jgi:hypothetical protein
MGAPAEIPLSRLKELSLKLDIPPAKAKTAPAPATALPKVTGG